MEKKLTYDVQQFDKTPSFFHEFQNLVKRKTKYAKKKSLRRLYLRMSTHFFFSSPPPLLLLLNSIDEKKSTIVTSCTSKERERKKTAQNNSRWIFLAE